MPDMWFDVDTAISEAPVNILPLIDDGDFKTRETGVVYNASGMDLVWNFVTSGGAYTQTAVTPTTSGNYDWAHQGDGMYSIEIPASGGASINNDTEGYGWFTGLADGVLPWRGPIIGFRAAAINDALTDGGDLLDVSVTQFAGSAITSASGIPEVKVQSIANNAITANSIASDAITDAKVASDVTIASVTGAVGSVTGNVGGSVASVAAGGISATSFAANALDAVWSTATRLLTAGTNIVLAKGTGVTGFNDPTSDANADALLDRANAIETSVTIRGAVRVMLAALAGKISGAETTSVVIRNVGDTKDRITATVDADGNRSAVTTDVS